MSTMIADLLPVLTPAQWLLIVLITLAAGTIQSATGFGFAVISVPFFLLVLDSLSAIQINIVLNLFNALVVAPKLWHLAEQRFFRPLVIGTLIGLPLGLALFNYADLADLKILVALVILGFALRLIWQKQSGDLGSEPKTLASQSVGACSGLLSTALAMPGPPILIYLAHFKLTKDQFRAINLSLYVVAYGGALLLQGTLGGMTRETWALSFLLVPLAALGGLIGHRVSRWLSPRAFRMLILGTLLFTGIYMLYQTLLT